MDLLLEKAQNGDIEAFEKIYHLQVKHIYALCVRICGESRKAEELTQDVFVRAWKKLNSFQKKSSFSTWLHRLAINLVLGHIRSEKRMDSKQEVLMAWDSLEKSSRADNPALRMDIETAIATLPKQARIVLVLHDIEGYRHDEISDFLKISEGTSKAHLHRARKLLRAMLKQ